MPLIIDFSDELERIRKYVTQSMGSSEQLGLEVYNILSSFEGDLSFLLGEIQSFLSMFFSDSRDGSGFVERLSEIRMTIENSLNALLQVVQLSETIFREIFGSSRGNSVIAQIIHATKEIDLILEELSMAATNSSITASQLGEAGGAFSILSREIQRESSRLSQHFSQIHTIIEQNFPALDTLREHITRFKQLEKLQASFSQLMEQFKAMEQGFFGFQQQLQASVQESGQKVPELLAHLVDQDIFRQELEHIIEFLDEATTRLRESKNLEDQGFLHFVIQISREIFDNGAQQFMESFQGVQQQMKELTQNCTGQMQEQLATFGQFFDPENVESLDRVVHEIMIITVQNTIFMQDVMENLANLKNFLSNFEQKIQLLEEHVQNSKGVIKRFQTMKILLKAELSRLTHLLGKKASDNQEQFEAILSHVQEKTKNLHSVVHSLGELYTRNQDDFDRYEELSERVISKEELKQVFDALQKLVKTMQLEYGALLDVVDERTDKVQLLESKFVVQIRSLESLEEATGQFLLRMQKTIPESDFDFRTDPAMKNLVERMTTYRERIVAQKHMEIEDVGSEGGEFTLF
ncbi:MAG TPA: hypothetical protein P5560_00745 [Thermotogota bacterium]|nr:hypothetical protein [Thermotogota bacterium]HRW91454.1 hypothetical protein [Thermotogota bacterium]